MEEIEETSGAVPEEIDNAFSSILTEEEQTIMQQVLDSLDSDTNNESSETTINPIIPPNSPTLLIEETTSRFSSALWFEAIKDQSVIIAGVGGIGSFVAFLLSRMQLHNITLYDMDKVESANISGQFYGTTDVNSYKVDAMAKNVRIFSNYYNVTALSRRYERTSLSQKIMICGFDNMESRKVFFNKWKIALAYYNPSECLFIDGRLLMEEFQVFAIKGDDKEAIKKYKEEWLFDDSEAEEPLCSAKQTTFMANMIGSVITNIFTNFVANQCDPIFPRDVPFLTTYDASRMYFKVEMQ